MVDQAQKQGPGRIRRGRRIKPSVVHLQLGTSEKLLWGVGGDGEGEALPTASHPPWSRVAIEG